MTTKKAATIRRTVFFFKNLVVFSATLILMSMLEIMSPSKTFAAATQSFGPNLINNPSFETTDAGGIPTSWGKGGYGNNVRELLYTSSSSQDGSMAAQVNIANLNSGDAKWFFSPITIEGGKTYQFSDYSFSDVATEIDAQVLMNDGTFQYIVLANPGPSSSYQKTTVQFTTPAGASTITIFHLIDRVGTLTVDNYSLNKVTTIAPPPTDIITNGDMETPGAGGPSLWSHGGWGTNTRTWSYPVVGVNGSSAAQVNITNYTSGDAKWYFTPIPLPAGNYTYSNSYQSDIPSTIDIQYHNTDGSYSYKDLIYLQPANSFTKTSASFTVPTGVQDVTIFHLIENVGSLTIDNASIVSNSGPKGIFQTGAVTLTFDDGWLSQYQNAIPKMNSATLKGTFYIATRQLADYGFAGFLSKNDVQALYSAGEEIGAHTQTHPHLTQLDVATQQQEIQGSRQDLLDLNVGPITSFAYPYGDYNPAIIQILKDSGITNARSAQPGFGTPSSDIYQLPHHEILSSTSPEEVYGWIDQALAQKTWLILEFHRIDDSGTAYAITPNNFDQVIDYLVQKSAPVVTMSEGLKSFAK